MGKAGNGVICTTKGQDVLPVTTKGSVQKRVAPSMVYDTNTCVRAGVRRQKRVAPSMVYDTNTCVRAGECKKKRAASASREVKQMRPVA